MVVKKKAKDAVITESDFRQLESLRGNPNYSLPIMLIVEMQNFVDRNKKRWKRYSHFVAEAIREKLEREGGK